MKNSAPAFFVAGLLVAAGLFLLTAASGCGLPSYSANDSDRPWGEKRGFQYQGDSQNR